MRFLSVAAAALLALALAPGAQAEEDSKIALGGLLYDNLPEMTAGDPPKGTHPAYPKDSKKNGKSTWRCKECHGWDYMGKDGAYGSGGSFTGIKGIRGMDGADVTKVMAVLKDKTHAIPEGMLSDAQFEALALFVAKGQADVTKVLDLATKKAKGNADRGAAYYNTICIKCHGNDGKKPKDMPESLGQLASRVPAEVLHKIRNADPAPEMPALRAFPLEVHSDILAYLQTLPLER